jgi:hypothetical protein
VPKYCYIRNCEGLLEFYLSEEERGRIEGLEKKLEVLMKGGRICGRTQNKSRYAFLNSGCWFI